MAFSVDGFTMGVMVRGGPTAPTVPPTRPTVTGGFDAQHDAIGGGVHRGWVHVVPVFRDDVEHRHDIG